MVCRDMGRSFVDSFRVRHVDEIFSSELCTGDDDSHDSDLGSPIQNSPPHQAASMSRAGMFSVRTMAMSVIYVSLCVAPAQALLAFRRVSNCCNNDSTQPRVRSPAGRSNSEPPPISSGQRFVSIPAHPSSCVAPASVFPRAGDASDWHSASDWQPFNINSACESHRAHAWLPRPTASPQTHKSSWGTHKAQHGVANENFASTSSHRCVELAQDATTKQTKKQRKKELKMRMLRRAIAKDATDRKKSRALDRMEFQVGKAGAGTRLPALKPENQFQGFNPLAIAKILRWFVRDTALCNTAVEPPTSDQWLKSCPEDIQRYCRPAADRSITISCGMIPEGADWSEKAARICGVSPAMTMLPSGMYQLHVAPGPAPNASGHWRSISCSATGALLPAPAALLHHMMGQALRDVRLQRNQMKRSVAESAKSGDTAARRGGPAGRGRRKGSGRSTGRQQQRRGRSGTGSRDGAMAAEIANQPVAFISGGVILDANQDQSILPATARVGGQEGARAGPAGHGAANHTVSARCGVAGGELQGDEATRDVAMHVHDACSAGGVAASEACSSGSGAVSQGSVPGLGAVSVATGAMGVDAQAAAVPVWAGPGVDAGGAASGRTPESGQRRASQHLKLGLGVTRAAAGVGIPADDACGASGDAVGAGEESGGAPGAAADAVPLFELAFEGFVLGGGGDTSDAVHPDDVPSVCCCCELSWKPCVCLLRRCVRGWERDGSVLLNTSTGEGFQCRAMRGHACWWPGLPLPAPILTALGGSSSSGWQGWSQGISDGCCLKCIWFASAAICICATPVIRTTVPAMCTDQFQLTDETLRPDLNALPGVLGSSRPHH